MPPVPTRNALRCCRCSSPRQASAMTTALSPLSTTLMTAILNSAVHISGSLSAGNQDMTPPFSDGAILRTHDYAPLSLRLRLAVAPITGDLREPYTELSRDGAAGNATVNRLPTPSASSSSV